MSRRRAAWVGVTLLAIGAISWTSAMGAGTPPIGGPIDVQVNRMVTSLRDGDAEHAMGSYYPGVGAFFSLDVVRGPNAVAGKPAERTVQGWLTYALKALGPKLDLVPAGESIGISAQFYDYDQTRYRTLTITARAATVAYPETFVVTLDGQTIADGSAVTVTPSPAPVATPAAAATIVETFDDPAVVRTAWRPVNGTWVVKDGALVQADTTGIDLATFRQAPIAGDTAITARMRYTADGPGTGDRGPGLLFNGAIAGRLAGSQMITYTFDGSYLKWGWFDASGSFTFQGGMTVPSGADGAPHDVGAILHGDTYDVTLDGRTLATDVPVVPAHGDRIGLIDTTAHAVFESLTIATLAGSAS